MKNPVVSPLKRIIRVFGPIVMAFILAILLLGQLHNTSIHVVAAPIDPPEGYPKFNQSVKIVSPTLAYVGGATLHYQIEVRNTGAYTADGVVVTDKLPAEVTYNNDAVDSHGNPVAFVNNTLSWTGLIGFDQTELISFSVNVAPTFSGKLENSALIQHSTLTMPLTVTAQTVITNDPILEISKKASPDVPGPNKTLTYQLEVTNVGQPGNIPIVVTDHIPALTTLKTPGADGTATPAGYVTFNRNVNLLTGETSVFTFSVDVQDVPSGTVITNDEYSVSYLTNQLDLGDPYTTTVLDPELYIAKQIVPDPPGSNGDASYTISVLNLGSLATNLVITDQLPISLTYLSGGDSFDALTRIVTWNVPALDTNEMVDVQVQVAVGDMAEVSILNLDYGVCSSEGICAPGEVLTSAVFGPSFKVSGWLDPMAKAPGGGTTPVTPTLVVKNEGPGSALGATAVLTFRRISVSQMDVLQTIPAGRGTFYVGLACGPKCNQYYWVGDIAADETITFTTNAGVSSIGGAEGTTYTATLVITDQLGSFVTEPVTGSAIGKITHLSNLIPTKTAPQEIGAGEILTYQINVFNSGQTTDMTFPPVLTETIPASTTLVSVSDSGISTTLNGRTTIEWELPSMGPGDIFYRSFAVRVMQDLVSGTLLVNDMYGTKWYEDQLTDYLSKTGEPITTVVKEVGLINSFKTVSPDILIPGTDNVLTYTLHIVNSGSNPRTGVLVTDLMPWQASTYQRDAVASAGTLISDIVSLTWNGDVPALSEVLITFTALVDADFTGILTNTAVITHDSLQAPVSISGVAYITDEPILLISKTATPSPVSSGEDLLYTIQITNMGQQATHLKITDPLPSNVTYVPGSASNGGALEAGSLNWDLLLLKSGESRQLTFRVTVGKGKEVVNQDYTVTCAEGASATGAPVVTPILGGNKGIFLPLIMR